MTSAMSTMTGPQAVNSYLESLILQGLSTSYVNKVGELLTTYVNSVSEVSPQSAAAFLHRYSGHKPNTRARYTTYMRGFMTHLGLPFNVKVRVPKQLPPFVAVEDIERIANWIREKQTHKATNFRDLVLLETAAKTGLRRSELADLTVADIDFRGSRLKVIEGKGGKDRVVPILPALLADLQALCADKKQSDRVFGLNPRSLGMKFHTWAKKAGVDLHTHSFRHYFATTLVERGANIRAVQELLGHTNLNTTQVYLAVTGRHLEETIGLLD